jgi:hypothetical protein
MNKMNQITFKQSRNWWTDKNLDWIIENASFVYTSNVSNNSHPRIVTKETINGMDCFEIDNDRHGIMITSESKFNWTDLVGVGQVTKNYHVVEFVKEFLIRWGAGEFVNPKPSIFKDTLNRFRKKKT